MKFLNPTDTLSTLASSLCCILLTACQPTSNDYSSEGLTPSIIRFGSVLPLEGRQEVFGHQMKAGLEAALKGQVVQNRILELRFQNDFYEPYQAVESSQKLVDEGIFLMIGNVGMPTAQLTLPLLKKHNIPVVGFLTGADFLRSGKGPVVNYRASYFQEIKSLIQASLETGLDPQEICAYVSSDQYGFKAIVNLQKVFQEENIALPPFPIRNNLGPVGVYPPNTPYVQEGYDSLKKWEEQTGNPCKLIITAGSYSNLARFARLAQQNNENWVVATISLTGADDFQLYLEEYGIQQGVIMTQVVPLLDSELPIVKEAQQQLGEQFSLISLEGYIVGKMTLEILNKIPGELNRENFMKQVIQSKFNLGGLEIDFTQDGNQGSQLVIISALTPSGYQALDNEMLTKMLEEVRK